MASIERYTTDAGPRYSVRYRTPDGRQTQKRDFKTKRDAELFLATTEVKMATGDYVAPKLGRVTVGELAPAWLERKRLLSASTYRGNELHWRLHVAPRWASTPVSAVDLLAVEAWITSLISSGAGAQTVRKSYSVLVGILNDAVKGKRLAANPAKGVENLPAMSKKRHVYLTANDVPRLAENAGNRRAFVLTLAYCGLRYGEAIALRVRNIEFLRRRLSVVESATYVGGGWSSVDPRRAAVCGRCRCPSSCWTRCQRSVSARVPTTWCSRAGPAATWCRFIRRGDGSQRRYGAAEFNASRHTT